MFRRIDTATRLAGVLLGLALASAARAEDVPGELRCIERARNQTVLQEEQREQLCLGATSLEPIDCYRSAVDQRALDPPDAIELCRCATSSEPVRCFREALRVRPSEPLWAVRQCSTIATQNLTSDCRPMVAIDPRAR